MKSTRKKRIAKTISLLGIMERFPNEQSAIDYLTGILWADGAVCPFCKSKEISVRKQRNYYRCRECREIFTIRVGTIFHRSHIPLHKWLYAMYLVVTSRKGISSYALSKMIGVKQEGAWFLLQRLRLACGNQAEKILSGIAEVDEVYLHGVEKNKHEWKKQNKGRGTVGKQPVLVLRGRDGTVRAKVVSKVTKGALHGFVRDNVAKGATVCTDEHKGYQGLGKRYDHRTVNHSAKQYVEGLASTNGTESVNSIIKRCYYGTHHNYSLRHAHYYVSEVVFRLNEGNCEIDTSERIKSLVLGMKGKRLTYQALISA